MKAHRGKRCTIAEFSALWNNHGMTLAEIGAQLGITLQAVTFRGKARGLPARPTHPRQRFFVINDPEFAPMFLAGVSPAELAAHYGCSHARIGRTAKRLGISRPKMTRWSVISIADYRTQQTVAMMAKTAAAEMAQFKLAEMCDRNDLSYTAGRKLKVAA